MKQKSKSELVKTDTNMRIGNKQSSKKKNTQTNTRHKSKTNSATVNMK